MQQDNEAAAVDMINHPPHYQGKLGFECIDVIESYDLGYHLGSAFAYLVRAGRKGDEAPDVAKAVWYLRRWQDEGTISHGADGLVLATPDDIVDAFEIQGPRAKAVHSILFAAAFGDDDENIEDAIRALTEPEAAAC